MLAKIKGRISASAIRPLSGEIFTIRPRLSSENAVMSNYDVYYVCARLFALAVNMTQLANDVYLCEILQFWHIDLLGGIFYA